MDHLREKLVPASLYEFTSDKFHSPGSHRTTTIYLATCLLITCAFVSLFFVKVQVNQNAVAIIRPETELSVIRSLVNGRILACEARENSFVEAGKVIFKIESDIPLQKEKFLQSRREEIEFLLSDLYELTSKLSSPSLSTPIYSQLFRSYGEKLLNAVTRSSKAKTDYERNLKLHEQKVIADVEFEGYEFEFRKAQTDVEILKQNQFSDWQNEITGYERERKEIENQLAQLDREKENMVIKAPVSGHVQNISGLYPGTTVFINQDLCQISPETNLLAEAYVHPNDIGLIQSDTPVRFQVTAFNYNQWGLATGRVKEVSNDIQIVDNQPVFKVRCILDNTFLQLKNGYKGYLKKGMTLQARFMVTERTLWQLLYDKADDWLNPNTITK